MTEGPNRSQWVVLELGPKAEGEDPDAVRKSIRHTIKDAEVFIPASVTQMGEDKVVQYLMEGYAFIRRDHADSIYYRLENTKYVEKVLRQPIHVNGGRPIRQIAVVTNDHIERFRSQLRVEVDQGISVGDMVLITSGPYRQITARVEEEIPERDAVQVYIKLRSKDAIVTLPRACLRLVQKADRSPLHDRSMAIREWLLRVRSLLAWPKDGILRVFLPYETYLRIESWNRRIHRGVEVIKASDTIRAFDLTFDTDMYTARMQEIAVLSRWEQQFTWGRRFFQVLDIEPLKAKSETLIQLHTYEKSLSPYVRLAYNPPSPDPLKRKLVELFYLQDVFDRLGTLGEDLDSLERTLKAGGSMVQNLVVDGTQLAIRCAVTPGLEHLTDKQGRPTGAIIGFMRSLGSWRKRHPGAEVHVTWDGSSQRRRQMYSGYKATRASRVPQAFETEWLRESLPHFGVHQAFHPEEEADDVIATLVRGALKGQRNVIVSTDRDLLQLVSETDHQFVPGVGAGKERVFDIDAVLQEYGVPPAQFLHVKALWGDTSDNIPGASGFGLKTSSKLVKLYGSIDRIFASNLAGLTKAQYGSLRASEKQVRLNIELMKLYDDLALTILRSDPNQIAATTRLRDVDIQPDPIVAAFFERAHEAVANV